MTFEFARPEEGEISLEEAIGQALGAASTCWENLHGTGVFDSDRAKEIYDALQVEILRKQKAINDRHEVELSTWKRRLVEETASLRRELEDRRARVKGILQNYWPGEYKPGDGDVIAFAKLDRRISDLFEPQPSTRPHKPE